jgi:hypothetical protein
MTKSYGMPKLMPQNAHQRELAAGFKGERTLVNQYVAGRTRFIGEESPGKILPVDIHRTDIEDNLRIIRSTVRILGCGISVLHIGDRLPDSCGFLHGLHNLGMPGIKALTDTIRELAFLRVIPDYILAIGLVHHEPR